MSGDEGAGRLVYASPVAELEEVVFPSHYSAAAEEEYDPAAPSLIYTPASPADTVLDLRSSFGRSLWTGTASPLYNSGSRAHGVDRTDSVIPDNSEAREQVPDHPCNYCRLHHWFSGPRATPCPPGTKLPQADRHSRGHGHTGSRSHLPESGCSICGVRHWCSGPQATPCAAPYLLDRCRAPRPRRIREKVAPERPCRQCRGFHYVTGPWRTSCKRHAQRSSLEADGGTHSRSQDRSSMDHVKQEEEHEQSLHVPWH